MINAIKDWLQMRWQDNQPVVSTAEWTGVNELTVTLGEYLSPGDTITLKMDFHGFRVEPEWCGKVTLDAAAD